MKVFAWTISLVASILAGLFLVYGLKNSAGAPQDSSAAAISACIAIIPYVFARAIEGLSPKE